MDVVTSLVTHLEPPEAVQPRERVLHNPAMAAQLLTGLDATACDTRDDAALPQRVATEPIVVSLVRMQLGRSLARPTERPTDGHDGIHGLCQHLAVMHVGARLRYREGNALAVDHNMALRARFAAIRRIRTGFRSPPGAGTLAESRDARVQSILSASPRRSSSTWCSFCQTPACCHACRRRQQVMPLPHPISWGNISQGMPVRSTKMMPVSTLRSGIRGRPPLGLGRSAGSSGSITCQSSSVNRGFAMPLSIPHYVGFC